MHPAKCSFTGLKSPAVRMDRGPFRMAQYIIMQYRHSVRMKCAMFIL